MLRYLALMLAMSGPAMAATPNPPAEPPPDDPALRSFTDSRGCVFLRADHGERVIWAPLLRPDGQQRCEEPQPGRLVQVGVYVDDENAMIAVTRLQALRLPAEIGPIQLRGQMMRVVTAGPFSGEEDLRAALRLLRRNGFADAFPQP